MTSSTFNFQFNRDFYKGIGISLGFHLALLLFFTVRAFLVPEMNLIHESAVRVDIVDLPDKITKRPTPPAPTPQPDSEKKLNPPTPPLPNEAVNLDKTKKKQQEALQKLKSMEALEKIKNSMKEEKSKTTSEPIKFKGNILSPGSDLTGLNKLQHEEYISNLDRHIKQYWTLPEWLAKKNYKAQVNVRIDSKGQVLAKSLVKSSGNPAYDEIVLDTIMKASPFPPPPEKFLAIVEVNGIIIGFPE